MKMLSKLVIISFLAAVSCAHITTVEEVNGLIDRTIAEIRKEEHIKVPGFPNVTIIGLDQLKREGDCSQTSRSGVFECKAVSHEAKVLSDGEHEKVELNFTFEVVVDSEGHLVRYEVVKTEISERIDDSAEFYGWLKKTWKKIKKAAEKALHLVIRKKVMDIVTAIATQILG